MLISALPLFFILLLYPLLYPVEFFFFLACAFFKSHVPVHSLARHNGGHLIIS